MTSSSSITAVPEPPFERRENALAPAIALAAPRIARALTLLGALLSLGLLAAFGYVLVDTRHIAWEQAGQSAANIARALDEDIARNIELFHLSLEAVREVVEGAVGAWSYNEYSEMSVDGLTPQLA